MQILGCQFARRSEDDQTSPLDLGIETIIVRTKRSSVQENVCACYVRS